MSHWWRAYDEAVDDPKLLLLPTDKHRWGWFCLLCIASAYGGSLPPIEVVAVKLRTTKHKAAELVTVLVTAGLIDRHDDGTFAPHNWAFRQFKSDVSTDRVKQFRKRQRNVSPNVSETPPDIQIQNTDSETTLRVVAPKRRRAEQLPEGFVPADYEPSDADELAKFTDHARSKGRTCVDWQAAWRNWKRSPYNTKGQANGRRYQSPGEAAIAHLDAEIAREQGANFTLDLSPGDWSTGCDEGS